MQITLGLIAPFLFVDNTPPATIAVLNLRVDGAVPHNSVLQEMPQHPRRHRVLHGNIIHAAVERA